MSFGYAEPTGRMAERRSESEAEVRAAVVASLREHLPTARIIHELNVGGGKNRADVAAVTSDHLVMVEIKSKRDKLTRLADQMRAFKGASHGAFAVLDEKWWIEHQRPIGTVYDLHPDAGAEHHSTPFWRYPKPDRSAWGGKWEFPRLGMSQPSARALLGLLWRDELAAVASRCRIAHSSRTSSIPLIDEIAYRCTGAEIARGVCAQLRARIFAEADEPIYFAAGAREATL